jgi:hypothetical protein
MFFLSESGSPSKLSSHPRQLNCLICSNIDPSISTSFKSHNFSFVRKYFEIVVFGSIYRQIAEVCLQSLHNEELKDLYC